MTLHCAQKFKSEVAQQKQKDGGCEQTPPNYANGKINITTRNGKHQFTRNGIIPHPHADDDPMRTVDPDSCGDVFHIR